MTRPAYARNVMNASPEYARRGARLIVFAGVKAWRSYQWFVGESDPADGRVNFCMVLPPEVADPLSLRWPVMGRRVLVFDAGASQARLDAVFVALKRDGAHAGELFRPGPIPLEWRSNGSALGFDDIRDWVEWQLVRLQPFSIAMQFDPAARKAHEMAVREHRVACLVEVMQSDTDYVEFFRGSPPGSVAAEALRRVAVAA